MLFTTILEAFVDNQISFLPCLSHSNTLKISFILFILHHKLWLFVYLYSHCFWIKIIRSMNNILLCSLYITAYNPLDIVGYSINVYMARLNESKLTGRYHAQVIGRIVVALGRGRRAGRRNCLGEAHGLILYLSIIYFSHLM